MQKISTKSFFLVIPTRERRDFLMNLLQDLNSFSDYISNCVIVDQSERFLGDDFNYDNYLFPIRILKGDITKGVNHSRNIALTEYSNEEWLFFLDDDLRISEQAFKQIINELEPNVIDVLIPGIIKDNLKSKKVVYDSILETIAKPYDYTKARFRLQVSSGLNVVKSSVFKEAGFYFDENFTIWGDDWDFGMRLLNAGANIYYQPQILVDHLDSYSGGQRDKAKTLNVNVEKKKLFFYFIHKHFSRTAFKREYQLSVLQGVKILITKGNLKELLTILKAYKLFKKMN
jgi:GT2 family glycosyltransferase